MRIQRVRDTIGIDYIKDYLYQDNEVTQDRFSEALKTMLTELPDQTFILLSYEGDEVTAFLIAFAPDNKNWIMVMQATQLPALKDEKVLNHLFLRLLLWADNFNRKELRIEIIAKTPSFVRKWIKGKYSRTYNYTIPTEFDLINLQEDNNVKGNNAKDD